MNIKDEPPSLNKHNIYLGLPTKFQVPGQNLEWVWWGVCAHTRMRVHTCMPVYTRLPVQCTRTHPDSSSSNHAVRLSIVPSIQRKNPSKPRKTLSSGAASKGLIPGEILQTYVVQNSRCENRKSKTWSAYFHPTWPERGRAIFPKSRRMLNQILLAMWPMWRDGAPLIFQESDSISCPGVTHVLGPQCDKAADVKAQQGHVLQSLITHLHLHC